MSTLSTILKTNTAICRECDNFMDQAELEKQRRYFWDSALTVMHGPPYQTNQDITAYPNDTLTIKFGEGDEKTYRMYSTAWMRSLDYLLYRYLTLVLHDKNYSEEIMVPVEIRGEYNHYLKDRSKDRRKKDHEFVLPDYYHEEDEIDTRSGDETTGYEYFKTTSPVAPAILNVFCHGLFPQASSVQVRGDPRRNAKLYELEGYENGVIPDFKPEDYIAYELMTGLSLSIEIMAIVLEMKMDRELRDHVLQHFFDHEIHSVVRLPFPYARANAARNYFLQVQMNYHKKPYQWSPNPAAVPLEETIAAAALSAREHINILYRTSFHPEASIIDPPISYVLNDSFVPKYYYTPDSIEIQSALEYIRKCNEDYTLPALYAIRGNLQTDKLVHLIKYPDPRYRLSFPDTDDLSIIESYKKQLLANLEVVASPPDCKNILNPKPEHLAVFTNPNHKYIPPLMHYVKTGTLLNSMEDNTLTMPVRDCERLFQKICYCVRIASINAYQDIYQIKHFLNKL